MKYKLLCFSFLSILTMLFGGGTFATIKAENSNVVYTFTAQLNKSNTAYAQNYDVTINDILWSLPGNQNFEGYIRIGGKGLDGEDRVMYTKTPINDAVGKLTFNHKGISNTNLKLNAVTVTVASDADFSEIIESVTKNDFTLEVGTEGSFDIEPSSGSWPADSYYKITYNVTNPKATNYGFQLASIVFYGAEGVSDTRTATTIELGETTTTGEVGATLALPTATVKAGDVNIEDATVTWSSSNEAVATIEGSSLKLNAAGIATIKATYAGNDTYKESTASFTLTVTAAPYTSIAAMLEDITATKTNIQYNFEDLLVTYVIGRYTYVNDGVSNMLFYGDNLGLVAGDKVNGSVKGQLYLYNNLPEIAVNAADIQITVASSDNQVIPTVVEVANLGINLNNYITVKNAVYVSANKKNLYFKVGEEEFVAYNQFNIELAATDTIVGKAYDITGFGGCYNTTIQIFPIEIKEASGDDPVDEPTLPLTATWDFQNLIPASIADVNIQGTKTETVASDVEGVKLTVISEGGKLQYNASGYAQFNVNTTIQVPVRNSGDEVTVVSYPGQSNYTVGGENATGQNEFVHTANASEKAQGYVEIIPTQTAYLYSIKVLQKSKLQEKPLYSTDFSDWTAAKAATSESTVTKTTKYSKETLNFAIYNTAVMSCTDSKFASHTELPHMALQAAKAANPYVKTSKLASVTKVRFIHGATGSNRGWKLEAKGDGDEDWVVISDAPANPAAWCEVTAEINRTNVELRWTNLNASQNAYMFELDIYGNVDMGNTPALGTFKANGETYIAGDIFAEQNDGSMAGTIELSKSAPMVSEANPLTELVAENGKIGEVTYNGNETSCTVTIPVTLGNNTINYIAKFVQKPDFTLTYYNTDGTYMGTQQVEKDAAIGTFAYDFATANAAEGQKVRGWFVAPDGGRKFTTADVITENKALHAVQTPIEVQSPSERYIFNLNDQYFYAEDHEAFEPVGNGYFHDTTHGWAFGNGDKVNLLVGGKANIVLYLCNYSSETAITLTSADGTEIDKIENGKVSPDGAIGTLKYEGEAGVVTLNFNGTSYLHKLIIANQAEPLYTYDAETKTYSVMAGKTAGLRGALDEANGSGNATIYLPNGTYDLGNDCLTTISGENITIKGESQEGVIIQNLPKAEGIGVTATLLNTSNYLTLENLTLKNAYPYYDPATGKASADAGRAVCLQDRGNYTVCRNVTMLSYQDTYYSNNSNGQFYFDNCEIHGLVDFICGGGDVFYENTTFYLESRELTEGVGDVTIAAPNGAKQYGYVMDNCVVDCHSKTFNWGRAWGSISNLVWLNTTLKQPSKIVSSRFTAAGMNSAADGFYEYNTLDEAGNVISPASNIINFTHATGNKKYETILTAEEAANYTKIKVFADAPEEFKNRVGANEQPTAIDNVVKPTTQNDVIYNLQGVRVEKANKGLYIVNGKKVVVK